MIAAEANILVDLGNKFATTMGLRHMSSTESHAKKRGTKMTASERKAAQMAANRKARMQWYAVGAALFVAVAVVIILVTVLTEGELPVGY